MESMGEKRARRRRVFTPEFKADVVERCRQGDRTLSQVAKEYDLPETAVRAWVNEADPTASISTASMPADRADGDRADGDRAGGADRADGDRAGGLTSAERDELAALRRENRRLRQDVETLKRAMVYFTR